MGASPLMALGMKAMAANYAALQTTGHNIANANVAGFSRQTAEFVTAQGQFTGAGYFGKGVDVATVTRAHDALLTRQANASAAFAAGDTVRAELLGRLEAAFPMGEAGLGAASGAFLDAFSDLASRPADSATRQVVLARAGELAARFGDANAQLDALQRDLREGMAVAVREVNALAQGIAQLNVQISNLRGQGQPPNDLFDARDRLVAQLAAQLQITTLPADDGSLSVFIAGGQRLVLGGEASPLAVAPDPADPSRIAVGVLDTGQLRPFDAAALGAGRLVGMLRVQGEDLVEARSRIGQLAAALAGQVNAQQALGLNLRLPAGSVPAQPFFAIGAPQALPDAGNARDGAGNLLGGVTLATVGPGELQASEYALEAVAGAPPGWRLTRLSDGQVTAPFTSGSVVDGVRITVTGSPAAGDRFLLQPVARAADLRLLLDDPRDIAAASPLTATLGPANAGTLQVAALTVTSAAADPQNTATLTFGSGGAYSWQLRDRTTNALVSSGTGTWAPGGPLPPAGGADINGFSLQFSGTPAPGDSVVVGLTPYPASHNGNALALAGLRDLALVGRSLVGGLPAGGATITDAYAAAMAEIGVRVQSAETAASISKAAATQAETARASAAGVNLDEEAARLLQYQQSYQAAARVLQVAQSLFDTLLEVAG